MKNQDNEIKYENGKFGIQWMCGRCGKKYSTKSLLELDLIQMKEGQPEYGKTPVCSCGYRFHLDKFVLKHPISVTLGKKKLKAVVSTVFLELKHDRNNWYETMVFPEHYGTKKDEFVCGLQRRYKTLIDAIDGHVEVILLLERGRYKFLDGDEEDFNDGKPELLIGVSAE